MEKFSNIELNPKLKSGQESGEEIRYSQLTFDERSYRLDCEKIKETCVLAYQYIQRHLEQLGIQITKTDFSPDLVSLKRFRSKGEPCGKYISGKNRISFYGPTNLHIILHEELHFVASDKNRGGYMNFEGKRLQRSGFHSVWQPPEKWKKPRDILRGLNEAITDKIASELQHDNQATFVQDFTNQFPDTVQSIISLATEQREADLKRVEATHRARYKAASEYFMEKGMEKKLKNLIRDSIVEEKTAIETRYQSVVQYPLGNDFVSKEPKMYDKLKNILDAILKKMAEHTVKEQKITFDQAMLMEWMKLKKAYFEGNTLYLRRINKIVGRDTLASFNKINNASLDEDGSERIDGLIEIIGADKNKT